MLLSWNGDKEELDKVEKYAEGLHLKLCSIERPYHYSRNNNELAKMGKQKCMLFLNDDVELKDDFASKAMSMLDNDNVAFVGSMLKRPDGTIQHAGVVAFVDGTGNLVGPAHYAYNHREVAMPDFTPLAVTGACMMCRREMFLAMGGFNEQYDEGFQDFEICVKAVVERKTNVCLTSHCQLHDESATRDPKVLPRDSEILGSFWRNHIPALMKSDSPSCGTIMEWRQK